MGKIKYTKLPYYGNPIKVEGTHLSFTLQPGRALDISSLFFDGTGIAFNAPDECEDVSCIPYREGEFPKHMVLGLLTTCGLENAGPEQKGEDGVLWLKHGSMSFNGVENVSIRGRDDELVITGEIIGNRYNKHHFNLMRTITFKDSENSITVDDRVLNSGNRDQICLMYHYNLGSPFLSPSVSVELPAFEIIPADNNAAENLMNLLSVDDPGDSSPEVFYTDSPFVRVHNTSLGFVFTLEKSSDTLPKLDIWKNFRKEKYVMSFEPCNAYPYGRLKQREKGNACYLESGESITYRTKVIVNKDN